MDVFFCQPQLLQAIKDEYDACEEARKELRKRKPVPKVPQAEESVQHATEDDGETLDDTYAQDLMVCLC